MRIYFDNEYISGTEIAAKYEEGLFRVVSSITGREDLCIVSTSNYGIFFKMLNGNIPSFHQYKKGAKLILQHLRFRRYVPELDSNINEAVLIVNGHICLGNLKDRLKLLPLSRIESMSFPNLKKYRIRLKKFYYLAEAYECSCLDRLTRMMNAVNEQYNAFKEAEDVSV